MIARTSGKLPMAPVSGRPLFHFLRSARDQITYLPATMRINLLLEIQVFCVQLAARILRSATCRRGAPLAAKPPRAGAGAISARINYGRRRRHRRTWGHLSTRAGRPVDHRSKGAARPKRPPTADQAAADRRHR